MKQTRKEKNEERRHQLVFTILGPLVGVFLKWRFNLIYDDLRKVKGPYLLLVNHNLELDPAVVGVAAGRQLYFVASEHIMRKGLGTWLLMYFFRPILHTKGRQGVQTVKQMIHTLRGGHSVCIFPEGDRSFNGLTGPILPTIGRVARCSGTKMVTYRIEGGYLTQPRWSLSLRKGRLRGRLVREYSPEELKQMTDEQVNQAICRDLYEDAYETQKKERIAYRGKNLAWGLESMLFCCPDCRKIGTLHSDSSRLFCDCGFEAVYDEYGELTDRNDHKYTVTELDLRQREELTRRAADCGKQALFSDPVTMYRIDDSHNILEETAGTLEAYGEWLDCGGKRFFYRDIQGMAIYSRNSVIIHMAGEEGHIEIKSDRKFCGLKYIYLYKAIKKQTGEAGE